MNYTSKLILALGLVAAASVSAQNDSVLKATQEKLALLKGEVNGLNESFLETKGTVDKLAKIKVSGYIQGQWQYADTNGAAAGAFAGGAFPTNSNQRLQLRRVRLKTIYDNVTSQYVFEFEARPSGVSLKDAEIILNEPWLKTFSLAMGLMDRPFGFEIPYSSSAHEAPERTRMYQTVFKDEKDLGVKLEANPGEKLGFLQYFNVKAGLYTGTSGYNAGTGDEIDSTVDLIGRVGFKLPFNDLNLAVDGGFSIYNGKVLSLNDSVFAASGDTSMKLSTGNLRHTVDRQVFGLDLQTYYTVPVIGDLIGGTSVRGEYLWGNTPGTSSANGPYGATAGTPIYDRKFSGWYVSWIQNYGTLFQSVVKYDVFDPNTHISGSDINAASARKLGVADLKYTTLGLGGIFYWDEAVRITAYYDMITNEKVNATAGSSLAAYKKDLKDNVLTIRAQVKF
jgi:hypothetical protein